MILGNFLHKMLYYSTYPKTDLRCGDKHIIPSIEAKHIISSIKYPLDFLQQWLLE